MVVATSLQNDLLEIGCFLPKEELEVVGVEVNMR